jgi:hypothetical protein
MILAHLRPSGSRSTGILLGAVLLLLAVPALLFANGGTLRLANVPMGEYRVSVFTDPTPVRPDSLDVSVLVIREGFEGVPEGLDVRVHAELIEGEGEHAHGAHPTPMEERATREQADDPRYYAAKFGLGSEGRWRITVSVSGEAGSGAASFELRARERGILGHPLVIWLLALLPLIAAAVWLRRDQDPGPAES